MMTWCLPPLLLTFQLQMQATIPAEVFLIPVKEITHKNCAPKGTQRVLKEQRQRLETTKVINDQSLQVS